MATGGWPADARAAELLRGLRSCDFDVVDEPPTKEWPAVPTLFRNAVRDRGTFFAAWTTAAVRRRNDSIRAGPGTDVVTSGGQASNSKTMRELLDAVAADDEVFAFGAFEASPPALKELRPFPSADAILSVGPSRGGLPAHAHGDTWLALAHGAKRWFVAAPGEPLADDWPLASSLRVYQAGGYANASTCLQRQGDVVFLPRGYTHATLNVGAAVALGQQAPYPARDRLRDADRVLKERPLDLTALHAKGVASAHLGLWREALAALSAAADRSDRPDVHVLKAEVLAATGRTPRAVAAVQSIHRRYRRREQDGALTDAALAATYLTFARFFLGIEQWALALEPLADALRLRPHDAAARHDLALARERLGSS